MTIQTAREQGDRDGVWRGLQLATTTLTDAQIKTLPSLGVTLVAAPGAGYVVLPIVCVFLASFAAGGYTVNPTAFVCLSWNSSISASKMMGAVYESGGSILSFAGVQFFPITLGSYTDGLGTNFPPGDELTAFENKALTVRGNNGGSSPFTDGNAANTLKVTVLYVLVDV